MVRSFARAAQGPHGSRRTTYALSKAAHARIQNSPSRDSPSENQIEFLDGKRAPTRRRPRKAKPGTKGLDPAQCRLEQSEGSCRGSRKSGQEGWGLRGGPL
jgi:hypothetical protein